VERLTGRDDEMKGAGGGGLLGKCGGREVGGDGENDGGAARWAHGGFSGEERRPEAHASSILRSNTRQLRDRL
jgi:hypothetical protein